METFAEQIAKHVAKYQRRLAHVTQGTVIMVGKAVVEYSPTGRWELWSDMWQKMRPASTYRAGEFKGSWSYSHGTVGGDFPSTIDASGALSVARFMEVKTAPTAARHFIYNNAPYAMAMETGTHPYISKWKLTPPNQRGAGAGAHMVQLALNDSKIFVRTAVAQARNMA